MPRSRRKGKNGPSNYERGQRARETVIDPYRKAYAPDHDDGEVIADVLADILHHCGQIGLEFDMLLLQARGHHEAEIEEEG